MILQRFSSYAGQKSKYMQANLTLWDAHTLGQTRNVRICGRGAAGGPTGPPKLKLCPCFIVVYYDFTRFSSYAGQKRKYMQANLTLWHAHILGQARNVRICGRGRTGRHIEPSKLKICPCFIMYYSYVFFLWWPKKQK